MRCFISIPVDEKIVEKIIEIQNQLKIPGVRLVAPENIHITLLFLGELSEREVENVKELLNKISFDCFEVYVKGVGAFPDKKYIKIMWVGIKSEKLISLAKLIYNKFKIKFEFVPHITIARIKKISPKNKNILIKILNKFDKIDFGNYVVEEIKLMKSILDKNGPQYSELFSRKLDKI